MSASAYMNGHYALVRVDDVGPDDERDRAVVAGLLEAGLAISCAVVPRWLHPATTRFLGDMRRRHGALLEVHQHGFTHDDRLGGPDAAEFGAFRDRDEQRRELRQGWEELEVALGDLLWPAFSPPYGAHDPALLDDLHACGFRVVSTLRPRHRLPGLPDFPTAVDWFAWAPRHERRWDQVQADWRALDAEPFAGLVLHPRFMAPDTIPLAGHRVRALTAGRRTLTFEQLAAAMPPGA
jgi:Polysaccharide deacetylase